MIIVPISDSRWGWESGIFLLSQLKKKCKIEFKLGSVVFICMNLEVFREINLSTKF